jgi:hypothetical protein
MDGGNTFGFTKGFDSLSAMRESTTITQELKPKANQLLESFKQLQGNYDAVADPTVKADLAKKISGLSANFQKAWENLDEESSVAEYKVSLEALTDIFNQAAREIESVAKVDSVVMKKTEPSNVEVIASNAPEVSISNPELTPEEVEALKDIPKFLSEKILYLKNTVMADLQRSGALSRSGPVGGTYLATEFEKELLQNRASLLGQFAILAGKLHEKPAGNYSETVKGLTKKIAEFETKVHTFKTGEPVLNKENKDINKLVTLEQKYQAQKEVLRIALNNVITVYAETGTHPNLLKSLQDKFAELDTMDFRSTEYLVSRDRLNACLDLLATKEKAQQLLQYVARSKFDTELKHIYDYNNKPALEQELNSLNTLIARLAPMTTLPENLPASVSSEGEIQTINQLLATTRAQAEKVRVLVLADQKAEKEASELRNLPTSQRAPRVPVSEFGEDWEAFADSMPLNAEYQKLMDQTPRYELSPESAELLPQFLIQFRRLRDVDRNMPAAHQMLVNYQRELERNPLRPTEVAPVAPAPEQLAPLVLERSQRINLRQQTDVLEPAEQVIATPEAVVAVAPTTLAEPFVVGSNETIYDDTEAAQFMGLGADSEVNPTISPAETPTENIATEEILPSTVPEPAIPSAAKLEPIVLGGAARELGPEAASEVRRGLINKLWTKSNLRKAVLAAMAAVSFAGPAGDGKEQAFSVTASAEASVGTLGDTATWTQNVTLPPQESVAEVVPVVPEFQNTPEALIDTTQESESTTISTPDKSTTLSEPAALVSNSVEDVPAAPLAAVPTLETVPTADTTKPDVVEEVPASFAVDTLEENIPRNFVDSDSSLAAVDVPVSLSESLISPDSPAVVEGKPAYEYIVEPGRLPEQYYRAMVENIDTTDLPKGVVETLANRSWNAFTTDRDALEKAGMKDGVARVFPQTKVSVDGAVEIFTSEVSLLRQKMNSGPYRELVTSSDSRGIADLMERAFAEKLSSLPERDKASVIAEAYANFSGQTADVATALSIESGDANIIRLGSVLNFELMAPYIDAALQARGMVQESSSLTPLSDVTKVENSADKEPVRSDSMTADSGNGEASATTSNVEIAPTLAAVHEDAPPTLTPENYPGGIEAFTMAINSWQEERFGIRVAEESGGWVSAVFNPGPANEKILTMTVAELNQLGQIDTETELRDACQANGFTPEVFNKVYGQIRSERATGTIDFDFNDTTSVDKLLTDCFLQEEMAKRRV